MGIVKTRFAPSNTGNLHAGSARTALFSWLHAKKNNGKCILRIEDTDKKRSTKESLDNILKDLQWLGLEFDEGPTVENSKPNKEYFQSQRNDIYVKYAQNLLKLNYATKKDGAIYLTPPDLDYSFYDGILGFISLREKLEPFAIVKSDGSAVFHLAVTIDDALMGITDIIRGQDHVTNTHKHIAIQKTLGFKTPNYNHIPLIMDENGEKLSKRRKDQLVNVNEFKDQGYLPDALCIYLAQLGWALPGNPNNYTSLKQLINVFNLAKVKASNARFDYNKLSFVNKIILDNMSADDFIKETLKFIDTKKYELKDADTLKVFHKKAKTLSDPIDQTRFLLKCPVLNKDLFENFDNCKNILNDILELFKVVDQWTRDQIDSAIRGYASLNNIKLGNIVQPIRIAISGQKISPPIDFSLEKLGRKESLSRLEKAIKVI